MVGAVGGGGAILALPVFVYVLGEGVGPASTASLIVVALAAAVGAGARARDGHICWRLALLFSAPAAVGSLGGGAAQCGGQPARADPSRSCRSCWSPPPRRGSALARGTPTRTATARLREAWVVGGRGRCWWAQ